MSKKKKTTAHTSAEKTEKTLFKPDGKLAVLNGVPLFAWVVFAIGCGAGIIQAILQLLRSNGLVLIDYFVYYIMTGLIFTGIAVLVTALLRLIPKTTYVRRMMLIVGAVFVLALWLTIFMWQAYLPCKFATRENNGHKVAIIKSLSLNSEVSTRLNAASAAYMEAAEQELAQAQAEGKTVEEVANTVTDVEILNVYSIHPVRGIFFYDANAKSEGNVYTLYGATSAQIKIDWPDENSVRIWAEGAEGEGEAVLTFE